MTLTWATSDDLHDYDETLLHRRCSKIPDGGHFGAIKKERDEEKEQDEPRLHFFCRHRGDGVLTSVQTPRCLTSATSDRGVQAGALCDVNLDHLLCTGWVDAYCLQQVGICCSTPKTHTNTQRGNSSCFYSYSLMPTVLQVIYYPLISPVISSNCLLSFFPPYGVYLILPDLS